MTHTRNTHSGTRFLIRIATAMTVLVLGVWTAGATEPAKCNHQSDPAKQATASAPQSQAAQPAQTAAPEVAGQAGIRAFIDPVTKQLRAPTPEEAAALNQPSREISSVTVEPVPLYHRSGAVGILLGDEYMNDVVVRRNADGTLSMVCVPHSQMEKALATPAAPAQPELEKE